MHKKPLKVIVGMIFIAGLWLTQCRQEPSSMVVTPVATPQLPDGLLTLTEIPSPLPEPTDIPSPKVITTEPRMVGITSEPIVEKGEAKGEMYVFSEYVRAADTLPDGRILGFSSDETLVLVDVDSNDGNASITSLVDDISPVFLAPPKSDYIFVTTKAEPDQLFPIWAIDATNSQPILVGLTSGIWPLYSATSDGKVVFIEDGHLTLKWIEENVIRSLPLKEIEEKLELNWDQFDLTQNPYYNGVPLIDFSISPDGQWLAIFDGGRGKFWLITVDGELVREVPFSPSSSAPGEGPSIRFHVWSPDSQWIGYRVGVWIDSPDPVNKNFAELQIVSVNDSDAPTTLASSPSMYGIEVVWSPNGEHLAFSATDGMRQLHPSGFPIEYLFLADGDGANIEQLSRLLAGDSVKSIYWAPSSQTITFKCQDPDIGQRGELCEIDVER